MVSPEAFRPQRPRCNSEKINFLLFMMKMYEEINVYVCF